MKYGQAGILLGVLGSFLGAMPLQAADDFHRNFSLKGVHLQLTCEQCHKNNRVLQGLSGECRVCHQQDDPHRGFLNPCSRCHTQTFWKMTTFHHSSTRFPLLGAHQLVACKGCHGQGLYEGLPHDCSRCHSQDAARVQRPPHRSPRFQDCQRCHNPFDFKQAGR